VGGGWGKAKRAAVEVVVGRPAEGKEARRGAPNACGGSRQRGAAAACNAEAARKMVKAAVVWGAQGAARTNAARRTGPICGGAPVGVRKSNLAWGRWCVVWCSVCVSVCVWGGQWCGVVMWGWQWQCVVCVGAW